MSKSNRIVKADLHYGKRQPRKPLRKQGTRKGAVLAAIREENAR